MSNKLEDIKWLYSIYLLLLNEMFTVRIWHVICCGSLPFRIGIKIQFILQIKAVYLIGLHFEIMCVLSLALTLGTLLRQAIHIEHTLAYSILMLGTLNIFLKKKSSLPWLVLWIGSMKFSNWKHFKKRKFQQFICIVKFICILPQVARNRTKNRWPVTFNLSYSK